MYEVTHPCSCSPVPYLPFLETAFLSLGGKNQRKVSFLEYFKWSCFCLGRLKMSLTCFLRGLFNAYWAMYNTVHVKMIKDTIRTFELFMNLTEKKITPT